MLKEAENCIEESVNFISYSKDFHMITELGDVNQDGNFNILDLVGIANIILYGSEDSFTFWAGDVNMDDTVNIQDIILIINMNFILVT